jgi:hypothetical protein
MRRTRKRTRRRAGEIRRKGPERKRNKGTKMEVGMVKKKGRT